MGDFFFYDATFLLTTCDLTILVDSGMTTISSTKKLALDLENRITGQTLLDVIKTIVTARDRSVGLQLATCTAPTLTGLTTGIECNFHVVTASGPGCHILAPTVPMKRGITTAPSSRKVTLTCGKVSWRLCSNSRRNYACAPSMGELQKAASSPAIVRSSAKYVLKSSTNG